MQSIATDSVLGGTLYEAQIARERAAFADTELRYRDNRQDAVKRGSAAALAPEASLISYWRKPVAREVAKYQKQWLAGKQTPHASFIAPIVELIAPQQAADAMLTTIFNEVCNEPNGMGRTKLFFALGEALAAEAGYAQMLTTEEGEKSIRSLYRRYKKMTATRLRKAHRRMYPNDDFRREVVVKVGSWAFFVLCQLCQLPTDDDGKADCFRVGYRVRRGKKHAIVRFTPTAEKYLEECHRKRRFLNPIRPLMVCKPMPRPEGPYITIRRPPVVKLRTLQRKRLEEADMATCYRALDEASDVPLRIHDRLAAVQEALWNEGGGIGIPNPEMRPYPPKPYGFDATKKGKEAWANVDPEQKKLWKMRAAAVHKYNIQSKSERETHLMRRQMVEEGMQWPALYCPMAFDSRGRMVPEPQYLNHYNNDVARSLLQYAEPTPLGADGLFWLAVHCANCYGVDKCSFSDRVKWVEENLDDIRKAARDPLGYRWWTTGDEKTRLQFLAACIAVDEPENHGRHQPVQLDATCNGTQHYAALGRDRALAELVNLVPTDAPNSLYQVVTDATKPRVEAEATDNPLAHYCLPALIRRVLKQPVMTDGYGVTLYGATDQILAQFDELGMLPEKPTPEQARESVNAARYLARTIIDEMAKISATSKRIKDWMVKTGKAVARTGRVVELTSPLGFPMVQKYRLWKGSEIKVVGCRIKMPSANDTEPPKIGKQGTALPPNTIHMWDGTVNALTILHGANEGIKLLTVCDSFWPAAGRATELKRIYNEQFVAMHERPLLDEMAEQLRELAPDAEIDDPPTRGDWDIRECLEAGYSIG